MRSRAAQKRTTQTKAPMALDEEVGRRIRARRVAQQMSQTALADAAGVTFQQIQKYEKGKNRLSSGRLQVIADALGVSSNFFTNGSGGEGDKKDAAALNEFMQLVRTDGMMRLVRAAAQLETKDRRTVLAIIERIAGVAE